MGYRNAPSRLPLKFYDAQARNPEQGATMSTVSLQQERRSDPRYHIDWPVLVCGDSQGREFSGRGQNLSRSGALVVLPLSVPLRPGQTVQMTLQPRTPGSSGPSPKRGVETRTARVVRVQREPRFLDGLQMVGLRFAE